MKHDFKKAINQLEAEIETARQAGYPMYDDPQVQAQLSAIRIADKLMQEPSADMLQAGSQQLYSGEGTWGRADCVFKAMRAQLLKEVDNA